MRRKFSESTEYNEGLTKLTKQGVSHFAEIQDANPLLKIYKACQKDKIAQPTSFLMLMTLPDSYRSHTNTWKQTNRWTVMELFEQYYAKANKSLGIDEPMYHNELEFFQKKTRYDGTEE